jgi:hypothetical protein
MAPMKKSRFLRNVLLTNGVVDLACAALLLVLPELGRPVLGYGVFCIVITAIGKVAIAQSALPMAVGVVYGALYVVAAARRRPAERPV